MLSRLKMSQKIIGGFLFVVVMLGAVVAFQVLAMEKLATLQAKVGKRAQDVVQLGHCMETLDMSYGTITNLIISRHLDDKASAELTELYSQVAKDTSLILTMADTEGEKALANAYITNFKAYLAIFKDEVLPLLQAKAGDNALDQTAMTTIRAMNDRMNEKRAAADAPLRQIVLSFSDELHKADSLFHQARTSSIAVATILGVFSAVIAMVLAFLLTRGITRPINDTVKTLRSTSDQIAAAAAQVSTSSQALAEGSSEQASALEETSASLEELTSMTKQNADNACQADSLMRQSLATINDTNTAMVEMDHSMAQIASASEQTFKIIKTIDEIAFQTNLLALNAAVEAARAGEAGAGFAVVADEVRSLAMRATEAAKNTAQLIEDTVQKVNAGKDIVTKVTGAFNEVNASSAKVGSLLGEITAASKEQAQGIGQINQSITQMDSVTQQNAASSEESAAAAEQLNAQAASMLDTVVVLYSLVEGQTSAAGQPKGASSSPRPPAKPVVPAKPAVKTAPRPALAAPAPRKKAAAPPPPSKASKAVDPESIIPMGDEDNFEDF